MFRGLGAARTGPPARAAEKEHRDVGQAGRDRRRGLGQLARGAADLDQAEGALAERPRESYVLATKVWGQMSDDPTDRGLSGAQAAQVAAAMTGLGALALEIGEVESVDINPIRVDGDVAKAVDALLVVKG